MKNVFINHYFCGVFKTLQFTSTKYEENPEKELNEMGKDISRRLVLLGNFQVEKDLDSLVYRIVFELLPQLYESQRRIEKMEKNEDNVEFLIYELKPLIKTQVDNKTDNKSFDNKTDDNSIGNKTDDNSIGNKTDDNSIGNNTDNNLIDNNTDNNLIDGGQVDNKTDNKSFDRGQVDNTIEINSKSADKEESLGESDFCPSSLMAGVIEGILDIYDSNFEVTAYNSNIKNTINQKNGNIIDQVIYAIKRKM